jgi:pyruvate dehydrogenase E2 component (dihydrolipoamide acetyltransferase)
VAEVVVMPKLGNTVESCLITSWLVDVGDSVEPATLLCEIETDKSAIEVPAGAAGTVLALLVTEGDDVPVLAPIMVLGEPGEDISGLILDATVAGEDATSVEAASVGVSPVVAAPGAAPVGVSPVGSAGLAVSPRARGLAAKQGITVSGLAGSGPDGRVIERDVLAAMAAGPGLTVGARAEAEEFVPAQLGTGFGGRVTRADLVAGPGGGLVPAVSAVPLEFPGPVADVRLQGVRKIVAERMMESLAGSAQLSYTMTAPAAGLLNLRARFKSSGPELGFSGVTVGDLVGFAVVKTLAEHPGLNAHLVDGIWRKFARVHLGIAMDTPRGLLVPTLRDADSLSLKAFSAAGKELAAQAAGGAISPDLLAGATFTVSNLGAFGIESFTPLLNLPQVAILGVNAITPRAVLGTSGQVSVEQRIGLSLTADHRVIDGADAARFLKDLGKTIEDIDLLLWG